MQKIFDFINKIENDDSIQIGENLKKMIYFIDFPGFGNKIACKLLIYAVLMCAIFTPNKLLNFSKKKRLMFQVKSYILQV